MAGFGIRVALREVLTAGLLTVAATASAAAQSYTQEQERLCTPDAMRLCSHEIPNVDRITACMVQKKRELSPGCRSVFNAGPQAKARPRVQRPQVATASPDGTPAPRRVARPAKAKAAPKPATASATPATSAAPKTARPAVRKPAPKPDASKG